MLAVAVPTKVLLTHYGQVPSGGGSALDASVNASGGSTKEDAIDAATEQVRGELELRRLRGEKGLGEEGPREEGLRDAPPESRAAITNPIPATITVEWLSQTMARGAPMIQCVVKRERSGLGLYPTYRMYIQRRPHGPPR